ncbi:MAG TPA: DUF3224 domain-containing protein [Candidatus Sulfotelmatobacter sp.]|nr:DUF3224 domain-containing protein [Candidatus Sulfotelmatobacter sp.]
MKSLTLNLAVSAAIGLCAMVFHPQPVHAQTANPSPKEVLVTNHATGTFDVKVVPADEKSDDPLLGRMTLDKQYHSDLEATGKGQMLTAGSAAKGSGAYVAIEKVTGTLHGHSGSFVLQHSGTMTQGVPHLAITVVPDSGTGQLAGIAGKMTITITDGKHMYDFEYTLPAAQ